MAGQKRPTRPVTQQADPLPSFDQPRWFGADGTLTSGRLEPADAAGAGEIEPPTPGGQSPSPASTDAALDSQPAEGVG